MDEPASMASAVTHSMAKAFMVVGVASTVVAAASTVVVAVVIVKKRK
jgi:hypothetical protein